jgi:hypothetical protein
LARTDDALRVLSSLERLRGRLSESFPRQVDDLTVVLHDSATSLAAANPMLPMLWAATGPAARPYVNGWATRHELHVLSPRAVRDRATRGQGADGSEAVLALAAPTLYVRRVIVESNQDLHRALGPARFATTLRWAWLLEGASRWFSGETRVARTAIVRRLRDGGRPSFPPSVRDAPLLAGTVIDLLVQEEGEQAAVALTARLHPGGSRGALTKAFGGRPLVHTEGTWRSQLSRMASGG